MKEEKFNKKLIGKRAKFKDNLLGYARDTWNRKGTIVGDENTPFMYLKLDVPLKKGIANSIITKKLIICENSYELLKKNKKIICNIKGGNNDKKKMRCLWKRKTK